MELRTNKIFEQFESLKIKIYEWKKIILSQFIPTDEFQPQFSSFTISISELSNQSLLARVSMPICRDISGLTDVISKCKRDRIRNPNPQIYIHILRSEFNVSAIVPPTHRVKSTQGVFDVRSHLTGSDPDINRGNIRPMGNLLNKSVDHLFEGGNLQRVPMSLGGGQTILNPTEDISMNVRGEVNYQRSMYGSRSPCYNVSGFRYFNECTG